MAIGQRCRRRQQRHENGECERGKGRAESVHRGLPFRSPATPTPRTPIVPSGPPRNQLLSSEDGANLEGDQRWPAIRGPLCGPRRRGRRRPHPRLSRGDARSGWRSDSMDGRAGHRRNTRRRAVRRCRGWSGQVAAPAGSLRELSDDDAGCRPAWALPGALRLSAPRSRALKVQGIAAIRAMVPSSSF
jgi:hypothetical protein